MAMTSDLVSATIVARAREPEGLRKMMMRVGGRAQHRDRRDRDGAVAVRHAPAGRDDHGRQFRGRYAGPRYRRHDGAVGPPGAEGRAQGRTAEAGAPDAARRADAGHGRADCQADAGQAGPAPAVAVDQGGAAVDRRDGASGPVEGGNRLDVERRRPLHRRNGRRQQPGQRQLLRSAVPRADGVADLRQLEARDRRRGEARHPLRDPAQRDPHRRHRPTAERLLHARQCRAARRRS